ncbi:MAG: cell wall-binding repeat-containing protein [Parcubacteria group bacterium]
MPYPQYLSRIAPRALLALALVAGGLYLGRPTAQVLASAAAIEKLYIGQQGLDNVVVFNADTISASSTPLTTIALGAGAEPEELVADDERPYLYVSDSALKVIHVINTNYDALEYSIPVSDTPQGLALSKNGYYLYVATASKVIKVDLRSRATVVSSATLSPGFTPWDIALSKNEDRVWVTTGGLSGEVRSFNPTTLTQTDSITPATAASGFGIVGDISDNNRAHFADPFVGSLRTFDDSTNSSSTFTSTSGFAAGPWAIESEPRSPSRYLTTDASGVSGDQVIEFSNSAPFTETRVLAGLGGSAGADRPTEIAFSSKVDRAFVPLQVSDKLSVINLNPSGALTEAAVVALDAGASPYGLEVTKSPKALIRFAGSNRYDTGRKVSQEAYGDKSVDALVVASLEVFPDSLVAAPVAGLLHGPLLGTRKSSLPDETKSEIARVFDNVDDPEQDVWVIGGSAVVEQSVIDAIKAINSKIDVGRIAGANRYETARLVADQMDDLRGAPASAAFLAKGSDFPDALTAGPIASNSTFNPFFMPILLSESDTLNAQAEAYLASVPLLGTIFLAGGTAALSTQVASDVAPYAGTITRLGGINRNDTARIIAAYFFPAGPTGIVFALNSNFPDALVAGPLAGISSLSGTTPTISVPILLVGKSSVPAETSSYLGSISTVTFGYIAGGTAAVKSSVEATLNGLY